MAGGNTAADNITLNLGTGGADVATEFISSVGHVQLIKLDVGDANTSTLVSTTDPLPVEIQGLGLTTGRDFDFLPVAGSTDGSTPVAVSIAGATLTVEEVGISGGTLDTIHRVDETYLMGGSAGYTAIDVKVVSTDVAGQEIGVTAGAGGVEVTGSIDIDNIAMPTVCTAGFMLVGTGATSGLSSFALESGLKLKNYIQDNDLGNSGGGYLTIAPQGLAVSAFPAGATNGLILAPGEEVFLEIANVNLIQLTATNRGAGLDNQVALSYFGS